MSDLRQPVPHWAVLKEQSTNRSRADSLLRIDSRINGSNWPDGGQASLLDTATPQKCYTLGCLYFDCSTESK